MKRLFVLIYIIFLFSAFSCERKASSESYLKLENLNSLVEDKPDSVYRVLKEISLDPNFSDDFMSRTYKAKYALVLTKAQYKSYKTFTSDSLINIAVSYYAGKKSYVREYSESMMYKGVVINDLGRYEEAMECYKNAETLLEPVAKSYNDFLNLGLINARIADVKSENTFARAEVITSLRKSWECYNKIGNEEREINILYHIGLKFLPNDADSALYYLNRSFELATKYNDIKHIYLNKYLIYNIYSATEKYDLVISDAYKLLKEYPDSTYLNNVYSTIAGSYIKKSQIDSAMKYYNYLQAHNYKSRVLDYTINEALGNYKRAYDILLEYYVESRMTFEKSVRNNIVELEKLYDYQKVLREKDKLEANYKNRMIIFSLGSVILLLIIGILIYLIRRYKNSIEQKEYILAELRRDLINKSKDKKYSTILNKNLSSLNQLVELSYTYENFPKKFISNFQEIINVKDADKGVLRDIKEMVNIERNNILTKLHEDYPILTESDINFIAALCAGFSTGSICALFSYENVNTVYVRKKRIEKKWVLI